MREGVKGYAVYSRKDRQGEQGFVKEFYMMSRMEHGKTL
jgi:hypothetical protein